MPFPCSQPQFGHKSRKEIQDKVFFLNTDNLKMKSPFKDEILLECCYCLSTKSLSSQGSCKYTSVHRTLELCRKPCQSQLVQRLGVVILNNYSLNNKLNQEYTSDAVIAMDGSLLSDTSFCTENGEN